MPRSERYYARKRGEVSYFTGKPCSRGHISERWTCNAKCKECHYEDNPLKLSPKPTEEEKKRKAKARARRWYEKNREKTIERAAKWKLENPESAYNWYKNFVTTPQGKATRFMRDSIRRCLVNKTDRTHNLLGYTKEELISHIEEQFKEGMSWDNHGNWHIDHIIPVSWFLKAGVNDPRVVNKLTNLRPLWAAENQRRNRK